MKSLKKVETQKANLAHTLGNRNFDHNDDGVHKIINDLNLTYEQLGFLPRGDIQLSAERQEHFNAKYDELQSQMEQNMLMTQDYRQV